jgi:hypothetical protein
VDLHPKDIEEIYKRMKEITTKEHYLKSIEDNLPF